MARGFPGDYICTIRVEPVPRNDGRPPLSFPLVSSRKSWSLDSLYREIYLSPPPPWRRRKSQWSSNAEERKVAEEEGIRLE